MAQYLAQILPKSDPLGADFIGSDAGLRPVTNPVKLENTLKKL